MEILKYNQRQDNPLLLFKEDNQFFYLYFHLNYYLKFFKESSFFRRNHIYYSQLYNLLYLDEAHDFLTIYGSHVIDYKDSFLQDIEKEFKNKSYSVLLRIQSQNTNNWNSFLTNYNLVRKFEQIYKIHKDYKLFIDLNLNFEILNNKLNLIVPSSNIINLYKL